MKAGANTILVEFKLDDRRYALKLPAVERIIAAVEVTPLPGAPDIMLGGLNVHGTVVPVFDIRSRFGLPRRATRLTDHIILARTVRRRTALIVDEVAGIITCPSSAVIHPGTSLPRLQYVEGVLPMDDGLLLIHDLAMFLSVREETALDDAMKSLAGQNL